ncbi:MAG: hypothetical protein ACTIJY_02225 [Luteimonas sp.]
MSAPFKFRAALAPEECQQICSEDAYVNDRSKRDAANAVFGIRTNWRNTRLKLDLMTPVMFTAVWAVLLAHGG